MATNPMQRRARNSFLVGFLLALIIMALVVMLLMYKIKNLNDEKTALLKLQQKVYVASDYIQSGAEVTMDSFKYETVQTTLSDEEFITDDDFVTVDEESGEEITKTILARTDIPAGSIITKEMLEEVDDKTTDDQRLQEYNMIILPTLLQNGDYIDIRLQLPEGEDYVVVAKKKVVYTTTDTVWIKLTEDERLTLGNAIVEAYTILGSKLYATTYTAAGLQEAATPTYPVSSAVLALINTDPNVLESAKQGLWQRYQDQEQVEQRNNHINAALSSYYETMKESVETALETEIEKTQEARAAYVESLEGTGLVGTDEE